MRKCWELSKVELGEIRRTKRVTLSLGDSAILLEQKSKGKLVIWLGCPPVDNLAIIPSSLSHPVHCTTEVVRFTYDWRPERTISGRKGEVVTRPLDKGMLCLMYNVFAMVLDGDESI